MSTDRFESGAFDYSFDNNNRQIDIIAICQ